MLRAAILATLLVLTSLSSASTSVVMAYPCDARSSLINPALGEPFYILSELSRTSTEEGNAQVSIASPFQQVVSAPLRNGSLKILTGPFVLLDERPTVFNIAVDDSAYRLTVTARRPVAAIEYFAPVALNTAVGVSADLRQTTSEAATVEAWAAVPSPLAWQQTGSGAAFVQRIVSATTGTVDLRFTARTTASSVRINRDLVRRAKVSDITNLAPEIRRWTRPESRIESGAGAIREFARGAVPKSYRSLPVYDVAEAIFSATRRTITYAPLYDGHATALRALQTRRGDCAYYAALFVAGCRALGIPARPIVGSVGGDGGWHVWAEFYVPSAGWVPVDPTFAKAYNPTGDRTIYFGVIPDLNTRVALCVGFDQTVGGHRLAYFQAPGLWITRGRFTDIRYSVSVAASSADRPVVP